MEFPAVDYEVWGRMGQYMNREDGKVFYAHAGDGPVLIMTHSFGGNSWWFCRVRDYFARHFSVYTIDLPGCARSDTPRAPYGQLDYAKMLRQFMDNLNIESAHVVADGGSAVSWVVFASQWPARVNKLVLENLVLWTKAEAEYWWKDKYSHLLDETGLPKPYEQWGDMKGRFPALDEHTRKLAVQRATQDFRDHGLWWATGLRLTQLGFDVNPYLSLVKSPTLLIYGDGSGNWHRDSERGALQSIQCAELEIIPGVTARSAFEQPELYVNVVFPFLTS